MCKEAYEDAIENASEILVEAMLSDVDGLIDEGRKLDAQVRQTTLKVGQKMLSKLYAVLEAVLIEDAKAEGMTVHRHKTVDFTTCLGPIEVGSPYMYDRKTGKSSRPMKEKLGVRGDGYSDEVDRALSDFGVEESFPKAARRFEEHYGFRIGRTTILRRTEQVARAAVEFVEKHLNEAGKAYEEPPARRSVADEMIVEADGCLIRCGRLMTAARARRQTDDPDELKRLSEREPDEVVRLQEWKEVRTGLVYRPGQIEPTYVCTRGSWQEVAGQLFLAACKHGLAFDTQVVGIGDGANGLKEGLEECFANMQFILDRLHLHQHVAECGEVLSGEHIEAVDEWVDEQMSQIDKGHVGRVIGELESTLKAIGPPPDTSTKSDDEPSAYERLNRLIKYLTRFYDCVDYDTYRQNDWPIGSGRVESAHRSIPQARLKKPGACWKEENVTAICALRCVRINGQWEDFWQWEEDRRQKAA